MNIFARFGIDRRGSTAVTFGLALLPLVASFGAALDYSRAAAARTDLQVAVDSTALALARDAGKLTDAQLADAGRKFFDANLRNRHSLDLTTFTVSRNQKVINVAAAGSVQTVVMQLMHYDTVPISAQADVAWGSRKVELALVLDNTGSMDEWPGGVHKIDALKDAALSLLKTLESASPTTGDVKVAIVPFDTQVNLGPTFSQMALDFGALNPAKWTGCVVDRDQPFDTTDEAPRLADPRTLFPARNCVTGALARLQPLTDNFATLRTTVTSMKPSGCTNITIGATWGLKALSASEPLTGGVPAGTANVDKYMVIVTDGTNTQNRWVDACSKAGTATAIDDRTKLACAEARGAGIKVYTVRVIDGNAGLLKQCASTDSKGQPLYTDVQNAGQLTSVFQGIAADILAVRLTL